MDFRRMLPGQAKRELTRILFERLESAKVNYRGEPIYRYSDAQDEFGHGIDLSFNPLRECWEQAERKYESVHPLNWDNEKQRCFRTGIPDEQHMW